MITLTLSDEDVAVVQEALSAAADQRSANLTDDQHDTLWTLMRTIHDAQKVDILNRIERL